MKPESLESSNPDLFSTLRRNLNSLKQSQTQQRRQAVDCLLQIVTQQSLSTGQFEEILQLGLKDLLKCFSDSSEYNRQHAVKTVIELLSRCRSLRSALPYIFAALTDRTNSNDLQGIHNVPQKMRPAPGQKPKVIIKLAQNCQQIRLLYCTLMLRILSLVEQEQIRDKLDQIVNILRALIMDPAPQVQKNACQLLEFFCKAFKLLLLHYTELMGRAVLLPLISKKSKIRIAGLNALTSVLWCGLWKYNAFIFENLVGFRDPNSVPIKDFYEPSNNINYLATFINDQNVKVRQQFLKHIKIWTCDLDDKYDHHGRIVPYILSGLFDQDDIVRQTALQTITEIGRQIQIQKEKDFRQSKQYAIDAAWTWQGKLINLPTQSPLVGRPSLGSRVFVRGHVRKFWTALYKEIKDINFQNRIRAAHLVLYGTIYTQNYMTQYLDVMLPHMLSSAVAERPEDQPVAALIRRTLHLIGRYCEVSAYHHLIASALRGELVQNGQFLRAALKALTQFVNGAFEAIPENTGLCLKKPQIDSLLSLIGDCGICSQLYRGNSKEGLELATAFLSGLTLKAKEEEVGELMQSHSLQLMRLFGVSHYQTCFGDLFAKESNIPQAVLPKTEFQFLQKLFPAYFQVLESFMQEAFLNPPALMDTDWKLVVFVHNALTQREGEREGLMLTLAQQVMGCSLSANRSVQMVDFCFKYISFLFSQVKDKHKLIPLHLLLKSSLANLFKFDPVKKLPIYDQHLAKPKTDPSLIRVNQDIFVPLFTHASQALQAYYYNKVEIPINGLASILHLYLAIFNKFSRDQRILSDGVRTIWLLLQRAGLTEENIKQLTFQEQGLQVNSCQQVIDFLVERLQTLNDPDRGRVNMVFDAFLGLIKCCPKIPDVLTKLPYFYPGYPMLLQKLFKYALDEKDLETRERYRELLIALCSKLRPWFQKQQTLSQEMSRFARANLLKSILSKAK